MKRGKKKLKGSSMKPVAKKLKLLFRCKLCKKDVGENDIWLCFVHKVKTGQKKLSPENKLQKMLWICKKCLGE